MAMYQIVSSPRSRLFERLSRAEARENVRADLNVDRFADFHAGFHHFHGDPTLSVAIIHEQSGGKHHFVDLIMTEWIEIIFLHELL